MERNEFSNNVSEDRQSGMDTAVLAGTPMERSGTILSENRYVAVDT